MTSASLKPLNADEHAAVSKNVELVKALMPEMADSIKALRAAGFDIGWRNVTYIGPHRTQQNNGVNAGQMVLESAERAKNRMGIHGNH